MSALLALLTKANASRGTDEKGDSDDDTLVDQKLVDEVYYSNRSVLTAGRKDDIVLIPDGPSASVTGSDESFTSTDPFSVIENWPYNPHSGFVLYSVLLPLTDMDIELLSTLNTCRNWV